MLFTTFVQYFDSSSVSTRRSVGRSSIPSSFFTQLLEQSFFLLYCNNYTYIITLTTTTKISIWSLFCCQLVDLWWVRARTNGWTQLLPLLLLYDLDTRYRVLLPPNYCITVAQDWLRWELKIIRLFIYFFLKFMIMIWGNWC